MITDDYHYLTLCIGDAPITEVECKLDLRHSNSDGWQLSGVHIEGMLIERDGYIKQRDGTKLVSPLATSIVGSAVCYFEENRQSILLDNHLLPPPANDWPQRDISRHI